MKAEAVAADLSQIQPGRDAELRAHALNEHRHQVRDHHDPDELVAILRAARDVRGKVSWIDIRDRRDKSGTQKWCEGLQSATLSTQRPLRCAEP